MMLYKERYRSPHIFYICVLLIVAFISSCSYGLYVVTFLAPDDPFEEACCVPENVRLYVCVLDGASILDSVENSSLAQGLISIYKSSNTEKAWGDIASRTQYSPVVLFKQLLGKRFVLIATQNVPDDNNTSPRNNGKHKKKNSKATEIRTEDTQEADFSSQAQGEEFERAKSEDWFSDWIIITDVNKAVAMKFVEAVEARVQKVKDGIVLYISGDGNLALAYLDDRLYIADSSRKDQLLSVLHKDFGKSLADILPFRVGTKNLTGSIGIYYNTSTRDINHSWNVAALSLDEQAVNVIVREAGTEFEEDSHAPKQQGQVNNNNKNNNNNSPEMTAVTVKSIMTDLFSNKGHANAYYYSLGHVSGNSSSDNVYLRVDNFSQPNNLRRNTFGLVQLLYKTEENLLNYVGPAVFTLIDTVKVKNNEGLVSGQDDYDLGPVIHWGLQVHDVNNTAKHMDKIMSSMLGSIGKWMKNDGDEDILVPETFPNDPKQIRSVDISCWTSDLGDLPGADSIELVWSTVTNAYNPNQSWWICSTNLNNHKNLIRTLATTEVADRSICEELNGNILSYGYISPESAKQMLSTWTVINNSTANSSMYAGIITISDLLNGLDSFDWLIHKDTDKDNNEIYVEKIYQARYSR